MITFSMLANMLWILSCCAQTSSTWIAVSMGPVDLDGI